VLCGLDLQWDHIDIMLTDERWVAEDSDRSNTRLLRQRLLKDRAAAANYLPLYADAPLPEHKLADLSAAIAKALPLSVLLLGMGADMHTASLFPGADKLAEALSPNAPILLAMRAPGAQEARITLTAPVLRKAMHTHILITGAEKRQAIEQARHLPPEQAPIALVLGAATVHWAP
jgi:6-phosphogluconolactonase